MGHPHAVDEEIFEVREGHFRCLINFTIHRITTMGEIKRIPKRNNFKNNCRYSILTLCLSLQGFVTIQTTIRNKPPKIKILTHIVLSHSFATSQIDFWQEKNFWKSDMESFFPGTVHLRIFFGKVILNHISPIRVRLQVLSLNFRQVSTFSDSSVFPSGIPVVHQTPHRSVPERLR